jgi:spore coat polysaccharide biosynthesis protein SpsF
MKRILVAVLACRHTGSRLFGKPFQNLDIKENIKIIDNLIDCLKKFKFISKIVLAISSGESNKSFISYAKFKNIQSVIGDEKDVLSRLIKAGVKFKATDILRVSSESPFLFHEILKDAWIKHKVQNYDFTTADNVIDGIGFEIINLAALKYSHKFGTAKHRSEFCSLFIRENVKKFKCQKLTIDKKFDRKDLRLTVDYPEDLILCREIYKRFKKEAPLIKVNDIILYLDKKKKLISLTKKYTKLGYQTLNKWR